MRYKHALRAIATSCLFGVSCSASDLKRPAPEEPSHTSPERSALKGGDEDYVQTPGGSFHRSCVYEVPSGSRLHADGRVLHNGREIAKRAACPHKRRSNPSRQLPTVNSWVSSSHTTAATNAHGYNWFNFMAGWFHVPTADPGANGQLLYFFNGLVTPSSTHIIQPVLQWGTSPAGGGNKWSIASWYVDNMGNATHSSLIDVLPGELLLGGMSGSNCTSVGVCDWWLYIVRHTNGQPNGTSGLSISATSRFNWAFKAALEAYDVTACNQYPTSDMIIFYDQYLYMPGPAVSDYNDVTNTQTWTNDVTAGLNPSCSETVTTFTGGHATLEWTSP
jgi:hypothetical protein